MVNALLRGESLMIVRSLSKAAMDNAWGTIVLRGGIVASNFAVMIGLAAFLGLAAFGELAVIWGLAMIAGTVLSGGVPLRLLGALTEARGMSARGLFVQLVVLPVSLTVLAFCLLQIVFPVADLIAILLGGLAINLATCLASIMRALGSVQTSMALRDAVPQMALGLAGVNMVEESANAILLHSALLLGLICTLALLWSVRHHRWKVLVRRDAQSGGIAWSLWGTALLGMVLAQIDIVVGGSLLSAEEIGLYVVLRRVANLVALPVSVATWVSATPVSSAYAADNMLKLQRESARGSQIALMPGLVLLGLALIALPLFNTMISQGAIADGRWAFLILALGAFAQVFFASSFTVATLCGQANAAALSRAVSIVFYLIIVFALRSDLGVFAHACIYAGATTTGTLLLWQILRHRLGVDTSAAVLRRREGAVWTLS